MIWRRLLVSGESTIEDLHYILQIAMGWSERVKKSLGKPSSRNHVDSSTLSQDVAMNYGIDQNQRGGGICCEL